MIQAADLTQLPGNTRAGRKARFLFALRYTSNKKKLPLGQLPEPPKIQMVVDDSGARSAAIAWQVHI
ncbi:hypothetical protein D3C84_930360 [compost metagenome]